MTISSEKYVGSDVSKDKLDVAIWDEKKGLEVANSKRGIAKLVKQMLGWHLHSSSWKPLGGTKKGW